MTAILLILWIPTIIGIVDAVRLPDAAWRASGNNKVLWIVLMVLLGWIGALIYFAAIRAKVARLT